MQSRSGAGILRGLRELRSLTAPTLALSPAKFSTATAPTDVVVVNMHSPHVAEFVLNQSKKLNSLDIPMIDAMVRELKKWKTNDT